jgi:adenine-specific DNA glycosylase
VQHDAQGRTLVQRRPAKGLWASLWQAPAIESPSPLTAASLKKRAQLPAHVRVLQDADFTFQTTHRDITFRVFRGTLARNVQLPPILAHESNRFVPLGELASLGMSSPMRRILLGSSPP